MKSPLKATRNALKRSRQNLAKLVPKRDARSALPVFEADTYAGRAPYESALTKAKRSDYNLQGLSDSSDEEAGPREHIKVNTKRRPWALVLAAAACFGVVGVTVTRTKPLPIYADNSLQTATDLFRRAATSEGLRSAEFTRATDALNPFLEALHLGLAPLVRVNVVKLQNAGAATSRSSIEDLVRAERRDGSDEADASVAIAVLWNGRILQLCERLVAAVLKSDAPMPELAHTAYKGTLERHHNWILRSGARALLRLTPDRRTLFERLGYGADDPSLKADLGAFAAAMKGCVDRLDALFRAADSRERL